jgi:hypothetical protein
MELELRGFAARHWSGPSPRPSRPVSQSGFYCGSSRATASLFGIYCVVASIVFSGILAV